MPGALDPYVPRLARTWPEGARWQSVDGTMASFDLSGFTRLSERLARQGRAGAEEITVVVSGIFTRLIDVASAGGGDILKFGGDAILVLFRGAGHEQRAAVAAAAMQRLIRIEGRVDAGGGAVRLRMSVGAHSGTFWFFLVGSSHRELVVAGPDATTTVELESAATAGQVLVSAATAEALPQGWLARGGPEGPVLRLARVPEPANGVGSLEPQAAASNADIEMLVPAGLRPTLLAETTAGEHRPACITFLEVPGLDEVGRRDGPAGILARLDAVAAAVDAAMAHHGIVWLASDIVADGAKLILAAGAPVAAENDEERMLRAMRDVSDACGGLQVGVNRGRIFMGDVGHPERRSYTVMGDAVNLAARLMAKAAPGEVIASRDVVERSAARFEVVPLEPFLVKGKTAPIHAVALGPLARWERSTAVIDQLPLIGRVEELERLRALAVGALDGNGAAVEIVAEPGMGKSRLVAELRTTTDALTWLTGHSEPYQQVTPYFPLRWLLRPLAGIELEEPADMASLALAAWVREVAPHLEPWLPLIAVCFGASAPSTEAVERLDPSLVQSRLQEAVAELLTAVVVDPTALVVEDLHWADQASVELLRRLAADASSRPWFLLVTRRPDGVPFGASEAVTLKLAPLDVEQAARLAVAAAGDVALADDALDRIARSGGGNPLFLRELAAASDDLHGAGEVPESVERLIGSRIDTLGPRDRALLRDASVLGGTIDLDLLAAVLDDRAAAGPVRWARLAAFVSNSAPGEMRFRHDLVRAGAYEALPYRRRRLLHGRAGDAILASHRERAGLASSLSWHFAAGARHAEAWTWSVRAAEEAQVSAAVTEVVELLERALVSARNLPDLPAGEVAQVAEQLGDAADRVGRFPLAARSFREARRLCGDDRLATVGLLRKEGGIADHEGRYVASLRWYGRGLARLDDDDSPAANRARADLQLAYGVTRYYQGKLHDALAWADRALALGRELGDPAIEAQAELQLEMACGDLRRPDRAEHGARALELLQGLGDDLRLGHLLLNLGVSEYNEGRWDEARTSYARSAEAYRRAGDVVGAASTLNNEAEILTDQGRIDEAQERLDDARRIYRSAGYQWGVALTTSGSSRLALRRGDIEGAHQLLDQAEAEFRSLDSAALVLDTRVRQVECLVVEGRADDALALADEVDEELAAFGNVAILPVTVLRLRAMAHVRLGALETAATTFDEVVRAARAEGVLYEVAMGLSGLEEVDRRAGRPASPERAEELRDICARLGVIALPPIAPP